MKKKAVALRYQRNRERAPRVVAKGSGEIAEKIVETAQRSNVVLHEDPGLADLLMNLDVDSVIPEEMYEAVAEVLTFVHRATLSKR